MEDHQKHDLGMRVSALDFAIRTVSHHRNDRDVSHFEVQKAAQQYYLFLKRSTRIKKPKANQ